MSASTTKQDLPFDCGYCGFVGTADRLPCLCENGPCAEPDMQTDCRDGSLGCPVCLDGAVDPWQLIRGVRSALESYDAGPLDADVDPELVPRPYDVFE